MPCYLIFEYKSQSEKCVFDSYKNNVCMKQLQQEKLLYQRICDKQMLRKIRSKMKKRAFRRRMQGIPKKDVGSLLFQKYSPVQYLLEQQKIQERYRDYYHVVAPSVLSLVKNREEVIHFINVIRAHLENKHKVFVVLSNVETITDDAIVVLLSSMVRFKEKHIDFDGNYPKSKNVAVKLEKSGFFKYLYSKGTEELSVKTLNNTIYTHGYKRADAVFASKIIEASSKVIWGTSRRCPGVQNTFTELMANTYKHAGGETEGTHRWWVSMTKDYDNKKVVFGFVDYGVGIFRSLKNKSPEDKLYGGLEKLLQKFPFADNDAKLMKLILEGQLHKTATQQTYRGRGLPYIHSCQMNDSIDSLVIISNNVYADVKNGEYKLLDNEFIGTFVTWEMNSTILNI